MLSTSWRECQGITQGSKKTTLKLGEGEGAIEEPSALKTIQANEKKLRLIIRGVGRLEVNCYVSGVLMLDWDNC